VVPAARAFDVAYLEALRRQRDTPDLDGVADEIATAIAREEKPVAAQPAPRPSR